MTLPKKKQGFRAITVDGEIFNWRYDAVIDIRPALHKANQLIVDTGVYGEFFTIHAIVSPDPTGLSPVTPGFIRKCIAFAKANQWDPGKKNGTMTVDYDKGEFTLRSTR